MNVPIILGWLLLFGVAVGHAKTLPRLTLGSWNIGPAHRLPRELSKLLVDAVALQESSDQWGDGGLIWKLRAAGYRLITGSQAGQSATPLAYNPLVLELVKVKRYLLAESQDVGAGAGPPHLKQKWAIGGLFRHRETGRFVWIFSVHYVASQQHATRFKVAVVMSNRMVLLGKRLVHALFMLGDTNANPDSKALDPLRAAGWLLNQTLGRLVRTHGRRAIDQCWWTPRRWLHFLGNRAVPTGSDHNLLVVQFGVQPRPEEHHHQEAA